MRTALTTLVTTLFRRGAGRPTAAKRHVPTGASRACRPGMAVLVTITVLVGLATPVAAKAGGNATNAHRCQKGGYLELRRTDGTPFRNAGDCTSYAAKGGAFQAPWTWNGVVVGSSQQGTGLNTTELRATGAGFTPNTPVTVTFSYLPARPEKPGVGGKSPDIIPTTTDATGSLSVGHERSCLPDLEPVTVTVTEAADAAKTATGVIPSVRCSMSFVWDGAITVGSSPVDALFSTITVRGTGFIPNYPVTVTLDNGPGPDMPAFAVTDGSGAFSHSTSIFCPGTAVPIGVTASDELGTITSSLSSLTCGVAEFAGFVHGMPLGSEFDTLDVILGRFTPNTAVTIVVGAGPDEPMLVYQVVTDASGAVSLHLTPEWCGPLTITASEDADPAHTAIGPGDVFCV